MDPVNIKREVWYKNNVLKICLTRPATRFAMWLWSPTSHAFSSESPWPSLFFFSSTSFSFCFFFTWYTTFQLRLDLRQRYIYWMRNCPGVSKQGCPQPRTRLHDPRPSRLGWLVSSLMDVTSAFASSSSSLACSGSNMGGSGLASRSCFSHAWEQFHRDSISDSITTIGSACGTTSLICGTRPWILVESDPRTPNKAKLVCERRISSFFFQIQSIAYGFKSLRFVVGVNPFAVMPHHAFQQLKIIHYTG